MIWLPRRRFLPVDSDVLSRVEGVLVLFLAVVVVSLQPFWNKKKATTSNMRTGGWTGSRRGALRPRRHKSSSHDFLALHTPPHPNKTLVGSGAAYYVRCSTAVVGSVRPPQRVNSTGRHTSSTRLTSLLVVRLIRGRQIRGRRLSRPTIVSFCKYSIQHWMIGAGAGGII